MNNPKTKPVKEFRLLSKARYQYSQTIKITSHSPKKYRYNYVHVLQELSFNIWDNIFSANEYRETPSDAQQYLKEAKISIAKMTDLLDLTHIDQCITLKEEAELGELLGEIQIIFDGWSKSIEK